MTHKQAVLNLLSDRKPHSHHELYSLGCVAHSRISDLRRDGYRIEQWREDGLYLYRLAGSLDEAPVSDPVMEAVAFDSAAGASSSVPSNPVGPGHPSHLDANAADPTDSARDGGTLLLFECMVDESAGLRGAYWDDAA